MTVMSRIDFLLIEAVRRLLQRQAAKGRSTSDVRRNLITAYAVFLFACAFTHQMFLLSAGQILASVVAACAALHPRFLETPQRTKADFEKVYARASREATDPGTRAFRIGSVVFLAVLVPLVVVGWISRGCLNEFLVFVILSNLAFTVFQYVSATPPSMPHSPSVMDVDAGAIPVTDSGSNISKAIN